MSIRALIVVPPDVEDALREFVRETQLTAPGSRKSLDYESAALALSTGRASSMPVTRPAANDRSVPARAARSSLSVAGLGGRTLPEFLIAAEPGFHCVARCQRLAQLALPDLVAEGSRLAGRESFFSHDLRGELRKPVSL